MKPFLIFVVLTASGLSLFAQNPVNSSSDGKIAGQPGSTPLSKDPAATKSRLTHFDLDFPGGTPRELVTAIQKAMKRPFNALVPHSSDDRLPAMKLNNITIVELSRAFQSLPGISSEVVSYGGPVYYQQYQVGFTAQEPYTDDTIWSFHSARGPTAKVTRFFLLAPYLSAGLTVDDITTAIQTGWKMAGISPQPALSFHKETKLLIAVGESDKVQAIEFVLSALQPLTTKPAATKSDVNKP